MKISKTYQNFVNRLDVYYDILEQKFLDYPENYLGPNWEAVINFWIYLDTLTKEQLKVVEKRYYTLSIKQRDMALNNAWKSAQKTTRYAYDSAAAVYRNVFSAGFSCQDATLELVGFERLLDQEQKLVIFPLFLYI